jgi:uncharacterized protein (DUF2225 family)
MTEFLTRSLRCPICNTEFSVDVAMPGRLLDRETDFRPRHEVADPIPTAIDVCPTCRFTAYARTYGWSPEEDDEATIIPSWTGRPPITLALPDDETIEELRQWIRRNEHTRGLSLAGREPNGVEKYLIGVRCFESIREKDNAGAADYWLRASWCARELGDARTEQKCQREAIARLAAALDDRQIPENDRARATYLVAELSRRAGDFPRAIDLYTRASELADPSDSEGKLLRVLARRQVALASAKSSVNAVIRVDGSEADDDDAA